MKIFFLLQLATLSVTLLERCFCFTDASIALQYFKQRKVTALNVLLCGSRGSWTDGRKSFHSELGDHPNALTNVKFTDVVTAEEFASTFRAKQYVTGVVVEVQCPEAWQFLNLMSEYRMMNGTFAYALVSNESFRSVSELLENVTNISFDSDVALLVENKVFDVYRTAMHEPLIFIEIGQWTTAGELTVSPKPRRWNLHGATLKAVTVVKEFKRELFDTTLFYDFNYLAFIDALSRFPVRQHRDIEQLMNFKTNLSICNDWGYYNKETGKFDSGSMYGELGERKFEFGLSLSWMFSERMTTCVFTPVTHHLTSCIVFRHPPAGASYSAFARPFSWGSWLTIFMFLILGSVCLYIVRKRTERRNSQTENELQFFTNFFHVAGVICIQSSYVQATKVPTRIIALFLQFMALMVYSYYGAEILGFLLTPSPRTITTVEKLLDTRMDFWVENLSYHKQHFKGVISAKATKYYELAIKGPTPDKDRFIDRMVGLERVQKGGAALYGVTPNLFENIKRTYSSSEICSLYFMDVLFIKTATPVQKQSPYREMYNKAVTWMLENGLSDYQDKRWHAQKPPCVGTEDNPAVKLEATFIAQIIYASGFVLAMAVFAFEKAFPPNGRTKMEH